MIDADTICGNCRKALRFHCNEHALQCCPGRCPGSTEKNERFMAPQPERPRAKDRDE